MNDTIRPLGNMEKYSWVRHNIGVYYNVAVSVRYEWKKLRGIEWTLEDKQVIPSKVENLIRPAIYGALAAVIETYPSLTVCLVDDKGEKEEPKFSRIPWLDLNKIVRFQKGGNVEATLENEHNEPFQTDDKNAPLWRLIVTFDAEGSKADERLGDKIGIVFVYHHAIGDGSSGRNFHTELLKHLNKGLVSEESILTTKISSLPKALEDCMAFKPTVGALIKTALVELMLPGFVKSRFARPFWTGDVATPSPPLPENNHTAVACMAIPAGEASKLYALCKKNGVTVHSALYIICLMATFRVFQEPKNSTMNLKTTTPISLRKECNVDNHDFGVYVCGYTDEISIRSASYQTSKDESIKAFWMHCKNYKSRLIKGQRAGISNSAMLAFIPKGQWEEFFKGSPRGNASTNGRSSSFEVSNLGVWSPSTQSTNEWIPKAARFSQSCNPLTDVMTIGVVSLADGPLTATVTWQEGEIRDSRQRIKDYIKEWEDLVSALMSDTKLPMLLIR